MRTLPKSDASAAGADGTCAGHQLEFSAKDMIDGTKKVLMIDASIATATARMNPSSTRANELNKS